MDFLDNYYQNQIELHGNAEEYADAMIKSDIKKSQKQLKEFFEENAFHLDGYTYEVRLPEYEENQYVFYGELLVLQHETEFNNFTYLLSNAEENGMYFGQLRIVEIGGEDYMSISFTFFSDEFKSYEDYIEEFEEL